jgi:DNA-directed RNA polymerase specialized sigma24 family protein
MKVSSVKRAEGGDTMAYTDLEALKARLRNAPTPKAKRAYRKRPKISESRQAELMVKLRESADFLEELKLELDALTYQSYKSGLTYDQLADALKINTSALSKRLMRIKDTLAK